MPPEQAFKILEEATARLQLTRADHVIIVKALETIKTKIEEKLQSSWQHLVACQTTGMEFITQNLPSIMAIVGAVVVLARIIVKLTPTPRDDSIVEKVVSVLKTVGLHIKD